MPLPKKKSGESLKKFITRAMASAVMKREYPNTKQRYAVARSLAKAAAKKKKE